MIYGVGVTLKIVQEMETIGPALPTLSVANKPSVWRPSTSGPKVAGDVHGRNAPASILHWKEATPEPVPSFPVKLNVALGLVLTVGG